MPRPPTRAYLALGSNLGDRVRYLRDAVAALPELAQMSPVYETDAVGGPTGQRPYLNMVVALETSRSARQLLAICQQLEQAAGRVRHERWGPRTLDADVLLAGEEVVDEPDLCVPHPRMWDRAFVVVPLVHVAPEYAPKVAALDATGVRLIGDLFEMNLETGD